MCVLKKRPSARGLFFALAKRAQLVYNVRREHDYLKYLRKRFSAAHHLTAPPCPTQIPAHQSELPPHFLFPPLSPTSTKSINPFCLWYPN